MTTHPVPYTLDTNILVHYVRRSRLWGHIRSRYNLLMIDPRPSICVVTVGELRSLADQWKWGRLKRDEMEFAFRYFQWIDVNDANILRTYSDIDARFAVSHGIGDNDVWIAAAAIATTSRLLTTDRDFDPIHAAGLLDREWIDPTLGGP